jgi:branched-chain amino acid transport system substrate-binding protein
MRHLRPALTTALAIVLATTTGCIASGPPSVETIRIGLIANLTGAFAEPGSELRDGFKLYLDMNGGRLGGHPADLLVADEGYSRDVAVASATKLLEDDRVSAITGIINGGNITALLPLVTAHQVPLVGALGRPELNDVTWVWNTNLLSVEPGRAIAPFVRQHVNGKVYAIGPNFQGGHDELRGFTETFLALGGKLANPDGTTATFTPFPDTTDFTPYLDAIAKTDADAVYCFFGAGNSVDFVTQYARSKVARLPLFAAGFVTDGEILKQQGDTAAGIYNALNYSPDLDNAANRAFINAWYAAYPDRVPNSIVMASYDAAAVLDRAIAKAGPHPSPADINAAISSLGQIDSPRGPWRFAHDTHAPIQKWYLRQVRRDGRALANVVVSELATLGG